MGTDKTFDNMQDALVYLETKAKDGEVILVDERATSTHPRRRNYYKKGTSQKDRNGKSDKLFKGKDNK